MGIRGSAFTFERYTEISPSRAQGSEALEGLKSSYISQDCREMGSCGRAKRDWRWQGLWKIPGPLEFWVTEIRSVDV